MPTCTVQYWSRAWSPPFRDWAAGQYSNMITITALLKKLRVKVMDWPSMSPDLNPIEHLWGILKQKVEEHKVSNIYQLIDVIMEEWKRTSVATCEGLTFVATQNIDTLGPIWTFSLRGVLTFVTSGLDINDCVLFWGDSKCTLIQSCTLTTLHCSKVSFLQCCHMKRYNKYVQKCEGYTPVRYCLYIYNVK